MSSCCELLLWSFWASCTLPILYLDFGIHGWKIFSRLVLTCLTCLNPKKRNARTQNMTCDSAFHPPHGAQKQHDCKMQNNVVCLYAFCGHGTATSLLSILSIYLLLSFYLTDFSLFFLLLYLPCM